RTMGATINATSEDVFVSWLPLYHDMGLIGAWLGSLYFACPLIIMSPLSFIARPQRWLWAIHRYRGTLSAGPNFAYELCLRRIDDKDIEGIDLSSWRMASNGAEQVLPVTVERFIERFSAYGFRRETMMPMYGLAESSVGLAFPPLDRGPLIDRVKRKPLMETGHAEPADEGDEAALRFIASGQPIAGHEIRIVDDAGRELPERRQGRLQFRGPSATSGYFRNTEKTGELFHDGWLESGDKAYIAGGDVFITGRSKDIIIRAGRNIYPEELEQAIGKVDGVRDGNVAVFGSPDPDTGTERLVILAETRRRGEEALEKQRLAVNAIVTDFTGEPPDEVVLAPPNSVLKTSSGKIRRAASRAYYETGDIGKPKRAVWLQVVRFSLSGLIPQARATLRNAAAVTYAGYLWALLGLGAVIGWVTLVLLPGQSLRWRAIRRILRGIIRLGGLSLTTHGADTLPPPDRPAVFVANHQSYLDGLLLAAALPRDIAFVAKAELRGNFFLRTGLERLDIEFVERFDAAKGLADSRRMIEHGRGGRWLLFFPEGTFMRMPGLLPFRMGAFDTAVAADLPVIPVAIRGARSILRGDTWFPRHGAARVIIGEPIDTAAIKAESGGSDFTAAIMLRDAARTWLLRHCGEPDLEHQRPPLLSGGAQKGNGSGV
ncbi:MAG: AMP-binding protein, partial [Rhodospirillales bacterium]|nr:AMP-binding protein [Rhodospirillales bacterium]